jgi:hypothetical protein
MNSQTARAAASASAADSRATLTAHSAQPGAATSTDSISYMDSGTGSDHGAGNSVLATHADRHASTAPPISHSRSLAPCSSSDLIMPSDAPVSIPIDAAFPNHTQPFAFPSPSLSSSSSSSSSLMASATAAFPLQGSGDGMGEDIESSLAGNSSSTNRSINHGDNGMRDSPGAISNTISTSASDLGHHDNTSSSTGANNTSTNNIASTTSTDNSGSSDSDADPAQAAAMQQASAALMALLAAVPPNLSAAAAGAVSSLIASILAQHNANHLSSAHSLGGANHPSSLSIGSGHHDVSGGDGGSQHAMADNAVTGVPLSSSSSSSPSSSLPPSSSANAVRGDSLGQPGASRASGHAGAGSIAAEADAAVAAAASAASSFQARVVGCEDNS